MAEAWLRAALLACALWLAGGAAPAQAELLELRTAQVTATVDGTVMHGAAALPYFWDRLHGNRPGLAVIEVPFTLAAPPDEPYAAYFSNVGNSAEFWLNGVLQTRYGTLERELTSDHAKVPHYLLLPAQLLRRDNLFRIVIQVEGGRRGGLSSVVVGPEHEVRARFDESYRWRVTGQIGVAVFCLIVGLIALLLWATQVAPDAEGTPRRSGLYLSAGVAELCWMLRMLDVAVTQPPLAWPWWGVLQNLAYAGWICCAALFAHHAAGWHRLPSMRWVRRALALLFLTAAPASWLALARHEDAYLTGWYGFASLLFIGYGGFYFWSALRHPTVQRLLVAVAGLVNVLIGFRDWLVIRAQANFEEVAWMRYSSVLFGLALCYIVIARFRQASEQARDLMANMAAKVRDKEQELAGSYRQLEQLAREQERTAERARILRDMHDGVGAHISAAIRQLQAGNASDEQLLQTLRDSLDQLKLSIDAMNLPPGDVTAMLANLRYRLEPRLKGADLALHWDVDRLPPLARLDAKAMRELQFMVFEALSNVLQHAHASELRIELHAALDGGARLRVIDNGCGFDPARVRPQGLASLHERAAALGAQLQVASVPGHTVVEIGLERLAR